MTSPDANLTVWFIPINANHRPIYDRPFVVNLPKNATITELEFKIREYLAEDRAPDSFSRVTVWRCTDPTKSFTEGDIDTLETEVKACFMNKQVRKPSVRSKVQDLRLLNSEILLVETTVARRVLYLVIDHNMQLISVKVTVVIARTIDELIERAEVNRKHGQPVVWRSLLKKLPTKAAQDQLTEMIDEIDFGDSEQVTILADDTLVTDFDPGEVFLVQEQGKDEDEEGEDDFLPLPSDENLNLDYEKTYSRIRKTKSPSTISKSAGYGKNQSVDRDIIYDGLYAPSTSAPDTVAPPVHIYHPIFWQFTRDANDPSLVPNSDFLMSVRNFMHGSCKVSSGELTSNNKLRKHLKKLLQWHIPVESNKDETRSDGVIMFNHPDARTPMVIAEFKRSLGEGGCDPSIQAGNSMRKKLGEDESKPIVDKCCCPVFMLAGGGPWLCVLGGVFINRFIVQRLTDMMWVGLGTTHEDRRVYQVAKVLLALKNSLPDLDRFYEFVTTTNKIPDFNANDDPHPRHFPYPHSFIGSDGDLVLFEYLGRLERDMRCVTYLARIKNTGEKVVVKFVDRYGAEVHQFLAEQGHAPRLFYYGPLPEKTIYDSSEQAPANQKPMNAGHQCLGPVVAPEMKMIVMEYITQSKPHLGDLKLSRDKIAAVLEKLRSNGYVFGDLREPNVLFDANEEVKLIDFDWAGRYDIQGLSRAQQEEIKKTWTRLSQGTDDSDALGRYTVKPTAEEQVEAEEVLEMLAPGTDDASDFFSRFAALTMDEQTKVKKAWKKLDDFADTPFASYPILLSPHVTWPDGAAPRSPILPAHDINMLADLYKHWLAASR